MKNIALMISWWLDSYIMYFYAKKNGFNPIPIWVDLWQPYAQKEFEAIQKFDFYSEIQILDIKDYSKIMNITLDNHIIPWRNLLLWMVWANYWEEVWIGALDWEQNWKNQDKSYEFFKQATEILSYNFKMIRERTELKTPFFHFSKATLIEWALKNWITEEQLKNTSTCYDKKEKNCWICLTCFKRFIAMELNWITEEYVVNPLESNYAKQVFKEIDEIKDKDVWSERFSPLKIKEYLIIKKKYENLS